MSATKTKSKTRFTTKKSTSDCETKATSYGVKRATYSSARAVSMSHCGRNLDERGSMTWPCRRCMRRKLCNSATLWLSKLSRLQSRPTPLLVSCLATAVLSSGGALEDALVEGTLKNR